MNIELTGVEDLINKLDSLADADFIEQAMQDACDLVESTAKDKAPKDSGELRRSITNKVEASSNNIKGTVYTPLEYAPYVEYGTGLFAEAGDGRKDVPWHYKDDKGEWHSTSGMRPHPYMRPALNESADDILTIFKQSIQEGLQ